MKLKELVKSANKFGDGDREGFLSIIYRNHAHEQAEIEVERARAELEQLRAEVLGTLADARYDTARAEEAEYDAEAQEKEAQYYDRALNGITNRV